MSEYKQDGLLTIAITSFNYAHYIEDAIKSVVNQTSPHWRLVIYDNGSTDNTLEVIDVYLKDPRVKLVVHSQNIGAKLNHEYAVKHCESEYFSILQADDFLTETFVEKALEFFQKFPESPFVFFNWHQYMDDTKKGLFHHRFPFAKDRSGPIRIAPFLTVCNFVPFHMVVLRTDVLHKFFDLVISSPLHQLGEQFFLKMLEDEYGCGCYTGTLGGVWRRHGKQLTSVQMASETAIIEEPLERHYYASTAPNPNYVNVFMALANFIRFCSHVSFFTAVGWLLNTEGVRYAESFKVPISTQRSRLEGIALLVALKFTTYSSIMLITESDLKTWMINLGFAPTRQDLRLMLSKIRAQEGEVLLNEQEIVAIGNRFFPFEEHEQIYLKWHQKHQLTEANAQLLAERTPAWKERPNFLIVTVFEKDDLRLLADTIDSLDLQFYKQWSLAVVATTPCPVSEIDELEMVYWIQVEGDPYQGINQVLQNVDIFDWVTVLNIGAVLTSEALSTCVDYLNLKPEWSFLYSDEDTRILGLDSITSGELEFVDPLLKPNFNLDLLRSTPYVGNFCVTRKRVLDDLGGFCGLGGLMNWDMALQVVDRLGGQAVGHIPEMLLHEPPRTLSDAEQNYLSAAGQVILERHLQRNTISATVSEGLVKNSYFIQYPLTSNPTVILVITVFDTVQLERLKNCLSAIIENTHYQAYQIVVTSVLSEKDIQKVIKQIHQNKVQISYLAYSGNTSSPLLNNALHSLKCDLLLMFSPDLLVIQNVWLERLVAHALRPEVGIVSARIVDADKKLYHAGIVLGMGDLGVADYPHQYIPMDHPGYMNRAQVVQNFSAVSSLLMLIKSELLTQFISENLAAGNIFTHIDFCIQVNKQGSLIVWTPFVSLVMPQQRFIERGQEELRADADAMLSKWLPELANDPAFNRHLSLKHKTFKVETETDVTWNPDFHDRLRVYAFPANDSGIGEYRVRAPMRALTKAAKLQCSLLPNHSETLIPDIVEIERVKPDVILLQNAMADYLIDAWKHYKKFNHSFLIYAQDDLIYSLPQKHPLHGVWPKDLRKRLYKLFANSDRLIVATEPLKEEFGKKIADVRLVPNFLEKARWTNLTFHKLVSFDKPRVGWAGGGQHQGDLEFILPVIEATKHEVDWVFFGMCPDVIRPHIKEFHGGVSFDDYPAKLASLNLDLAVAPLEYNNFNIAKTNLRLLEYGILGWPVVCTDIFPYQNAPVTRVANLPHLWIKIIRDKVHDLDALKNEGKILQQWVLDNYLLEDHLDDWLSALTP